MAIVRREESAPAVRSNRGWDPFSAMRDLMGWDPFQEMAPQRWRGSEDRLVFAPAFDVKEGRDAYVFKADLPGFREQDVDINITGNRLTVSGQRESEHVEDTDTFYCSERSYGSFTRSFTLPDGINADQIHAELQSGVLTVQVPKAQEAQPKRIALQKGAPAGEKKAKA